VGLLHQTFYDNSGETQKCNLFRYQDEKPAVKHLSLFTSAQKTCPGKLASSAKPAEIF